MPASTRAQRVSESCCSRCNRNARKARLVSGNKIAAIIPARIGHSTQVRTTLPIMFRSVGAPLQRFHPTRAPTTAWLVDTGNPRRVMNKTVSPALMLAVQASARLSMAASLPRVSVGPAPLITAPRITPRLQRAAADANRSIRVPTAVPNTLAASLAPRAQPKNSPPPRKIRRDKSTMEGSDPSFDCADS